MNPPDCGPIALCGRGTVPHISPGTMTQEPMQDAADAAGDETQIDELEALRAEIEQLRAQSLIERADLENQRKRLAREIEQARKFANERLLGDLLPLFDAIEAGLANAATDDPLRAGLELTLRQLQIVAGKNGLTEVAPAAARASKHSRAVRPEWVLPRWVKTICAATGTSTAALTPRRAASSRVRLAKVSSMMKSAPPSTRARACSAKIPSISAASAMSSARRPRGPTAPATQRSSPASARASSAPRRLISRVRPPRSKRPSLTRLAPKVLVSRTSAPAWT